MSNGISSNGGSRVGGAHSSSIPPAVKKMVKSLKEIVKNCPEHEIYAMLRECRMDPNETIHRLLSQDTFHEVKSKREKKKEMKGSTEVRSQAVGSTLNHGGRVGGGHNVGLSGSTQLSSIESGFARGKPAYKKQNGANNFPKSSSESAENNVYHRSTLFSNSISKQNTEQMIGTADSFVSLQPSSGFQPTCLGFPGRRSMADIVKMGRPHIKASSFPISVTETSYSPHNAIMWNTSRDTVKRRQVSTPLSSEDTKKGAEIIHEPSITLDQHFSHDDWPLIDRSPAASGSSVPEPSAMYAVFADSSLHQSPWEETGTITNLAANCNGFASTSDRQIFASNSGGETVLDDISVKDKGSYQTQRLAFEHQEGSGGSLRVSDLECPAPSSLVEDVCVTASLVASSLQQLSFHNEELGAPPKDNKPSLIIPDHLQVSTAECSCLSFGSFRFGTSAVFSGSFTSKIPKDNFEEASVAGNASSAEKSRTIHSEYYDKEQVTSASEENIDSLPSSQLEIIKHDAAAEAMQYPFPSSVPGNAFENAAQTNGVTDSHAQTSSELQNLALFSSPMEAYTNPLPSHLLASTVQQSQESDLLHSPYSLLESMPTKYSSRASSVSDPTMSMPEAVKPIVFSTPQLIEQAMPSTSIPTGPARSQHLPFHPVTQPAIPLGHFASMIGYPFAPQSCAYLSSFLQQAYAAVNSGYNQSPAAAYSGDITYSLPQYKNSVSSSLPQSVASFYGGLGNLTSIPGSSTLNPSNTPLSTSVGYEGLIGSQHEDNNHCIPQQKEAAARWVHRPGSRTIPTRSYYTLQGQNQHVLQQGQQPLHYGDTGYLNFSHSETGVLQEHQQTPGNGALSATQFPPTQQSHQIWQQSY